MMPRRAAPAGQPARRDPEWALPGRGPTARKGRSSTYCGQETLSLLGQRSGGMEVNLRGQDVFVITPESLLGAELIGKKVGDRIKLKTRGPAREFRVIAVS